MFLAIVAAAAPLAFLPISAVGEPATQPSQATITDGPATQPALRRGLGGPGIRGNIGRDGGLWSRVFGPTTAGAQGGGQPPTEAERDEAMAFLKEHSPKRAALLDTIRPVPRERVLNAVVLRYRPIKRMQGSDPELYNLLVRQFEVQDEALGLMEQLGKSGTDAKDQATAAQALHDKVAQWVNLNLQVRQVRLDRLKKTLEREEDRLEKDTSNKDELIDRAFGRAKDDAGRLNRRLNGTTRRADPAGELGTSMNAEPSGDRDANGVAQAGAPGTSDVAGR
jgi:hypothetical protein